MRPSSWRWPEIGRIPRATGWMRWDILALLLFLLIFAPVVVAAYLGETHHLTVFGGLMALWTAGLGALALNVFARSWLKRARWTPRRPARLPPLPLLLGLIGALLAAGSIAIADLLWLRDGSLVAQLLTLGVVGALLGITAALFLRRGIL